MTTTFLWPPNTQINESTYQNFDWKFKNIPNIRHLETPSINSVITYHSVYELGRRARVSNLYNSATPDSATPDYITLIINEDAPRINVDRIIDRIDNRHITNLINYCRTPSRPTLQISMPIDVLIQVGPKSYADLTMTNAEFIINIINILQHWDSDLARTNIAILTQGFIERPN